MWQELLITFNKDTNQTPREALDNIQTKMADDPTFYREPHEKPIGRFHYVVTDAFEIVGSSGLLAAARLPLDFYEIAHKITTLNPRQYPEDISSEIAVKEISEQLDPAYLAMLPEIISRRAKAAHIDMLNRKYQRLWRILGGNGINPFSREYDIQGSPEDGIFDDDIQVVDTVLYDRLLKPHEGEDRTEDGILEFVDWDRDPVTREFIGRKWITTARYHF